jgi:hypothetical protein
VAKHRDSEVGAEIVTEGIQLHPIVQIAAIVFASLVGSGGGVWVAIRFVVSDLTALKRTTAKLPALSTTVAQHAKEIESLRETRHDHGDWLHRLTGKSDLLEQRVDQLEERAS